eukprot:TRINITY_DN11205_c0_g1_i1.p1 TRINITY_DN11205_c0_g1~~TRINITY_DN11205_c0_g1_i1.p1  ORF type:complete len:203 (+),score=24.66 TRINITY_DN11205_c0_g1_i1:121-729(+)
MEFLDERKYKKQSNWVFVLCIVQIGVVILFDQMMFANIGVAIFSIIGIAGIRNRNTRLIVPHYIFSFLFYLFSVFISVMMVLDCTDCSALSYIIVFLVMLIQTVGLQNERALIHQLNSIAHRPIESVHSEPVQPVIQSDLGQTTFPVPNAPPSYASYNMIPVPMYTPVAGNGSSAELPQYMAVTYPQFYQVQPASVEEPSKK